MDTQTIYHAGLSHSVDQDKVDAIAEAMESEVELPPVLVYDDGNGYHVIDGNHRVTAGRQTGYGVEAIILSAEELSNACTEVHGDPYFHDHCHDLLDWAAVIEEAGYPDIARQLSDQ